MKLNICQDVASFCFGAMSSIWMCFGPWFDPQTVDQVSNLKSILTRSNLKYFNFEKRLNKIINGVLMLAIYQIYPILRIRPNLLTGRLISQGYHVGIYISTVTWSTTNGRGLQATKKHKICLAEGRDISPPRFGCID